MIFSLLIYHTQGDKPAQIIINFFILPSLTHRHRSNDHLKPSFLPMSIRAVNTRSFFLPSPPSLSSVPRFFSAYRRLPAVRFHPPTSPCYGCRTQRRSIQSLFESVMEELKAIRKSRKKIVSVNASSSKYVFLPLCKNSLY